MSGIQINLVCCTDVILSELAHDFPRKNVAFTYAMAIKSEHQEADCPDWRRINAAILEKWGKRGLTMVKNRAWRILKGEEQP